MERPDFFELKNGEKVKLPFTDKEYNDRVQSRSEMYQKQYWGCAKDLKKKRFFIF